jgi:hypothetical protein
MKPPFPNSTWAEWLARKLLRIAARLDPDTRFVHQAGEYKFERGWQQPVATNAFVKNED